MIGELTFMVVNSSQIIAEQFVDDMAEDSLLPSSVTAVIDRAVASGDTAGIDAVARYARQAQVHCRDRWSGACIHIGRDISHQSFCYTDQTICLSTW